ncbi:nucleotidyltransferase family protein [Pseudomonas sp. PSKL.D1]|uniref:nucleotidyltransferase family protein n=1 Tax=Pseudomonas sp. PSKL.D1 TaxID=3029060 RepID=UPI0023815811|nr:nucleotidyltransferase family protein [Pseudomonas sp. PSKL.D1]WDY60620.1 nucleotidyltransferase family protein [Pseudomonas sp. PSKL.D1]
MQTLNDDCVLAMALENSINRALFTLLPKLSIPQCMLTAGCLFQTVWNLRAGLAPEWGIKDYDVAYFDQDLSWEAEDEIITRVNHACAHLSVNVEVRNQARIYLWYEAKFGAAYPRLQRVTDGIDRYLISSTCLGVDVYTQALYATHGLDDLQHDQLRMNALNPQPELFRAKAASYRERWPWLTLVDA